METSANAREPDGVQLAASAWERHGRNTLVLLAGAAGTAALYACYGAPNAARFFLAFVASLFLVPAAAWLARRVNATVLPGGRSIHAESTPLLGGLALLLPLDAALLSLHTPFATGLALGAALIAVAGLVDDLRTLPPNVKILCQVAAGLFLVSAGAKITSLDFPPLGSAATPGLSGELLLLAWVVLVTNAINLIDGMDGLAAGVCLLGAVGCMVLGANAGVAVVLAGCLLGFLRHNLPRARIFLGDSGSLLIGFLLSALFLVPRGGGLNVPCALALLGLPLGDVALSALRRWLRGKPIFAGDQGHVHHLLLRLWKSPAKALSALLFFAAAQIALVLVYPDLYGFACAAAVWLLFGALLAAAARPRWTGILLQRRRFQRIHLVRRYASEALRLAEHEREVEGVLRRVAADLDLRGVHLRGIEISRGEGGAEHLVECSQGCVSWRREPTEGESPVYVEEIQTILCELLRRAQARLGELQAASAAPESSSNPGERPLTHFVVSSLANLERIQPLLAEASRRGHLRPVVVNVFRRDDLGLFDLFEDETRLPAPDVDLDVVPSDGPVETARILERYDELMEVSRPSLVVVLGNSNAAVAGAVVAKAHDLPVAHLDAGPESIERDTSRGVNRMVAGVIADLLIPAWSDSAALHRDAPRRLSELRAGIGRAEDAGTVVPALEELAAGARSVA